MSSSVTRMRRPWGRPCQSRLVRTGQQITMFSPRPLKLIPTCLWNPSPKASNSVTDAVPQMIPNTVRNVRSFWVSRSEKNCLR